MGQPRALSYVRKLVSLVTGAHPALAAGLGQDPVVEEASCAFRMLTIRAMANDAVICTQASLTEWSPSGISRRSRRAVETTIVAASGRKHGLGSAAM